MRSIQEVGLHEPVSSASIHTCLAPSGTASGVARHHQLPSLMACCQPQRPRLKGLSSKGLPALQQASLWAPCTYSSLFHSAD